MTDKTIQQAAYLQGYLNKEALPTLTDAGKGALSILGFGARKGSDLAVEVAKSSASLMATVAAVAPVLLGVAGGYTMSKLTSPPEKSKLLQKRLVNHEMREALAELKHRRDLERELEEEEDQNSSKAVSAPGGRSLRLV